MPFYESNEDTRGFQADSWAQQAQGRVADQWAASAVADAPDRAAAAEQQAQQAAQQQAAAQVQAAAEAQRQAQEQASQQAAAAAEAAQQQAAAQQAAADQWSSQAYSNAATAATGVAPAPAPAPPPATPAPQPAPQVDVNGGATQTAAAVGPSTPLPSASSGNYVAYAWQAAQNAGLDPNVFVRQIQQESGFNPSAKSPAGAIGIAQFMPATARGAGIDPTNPLASLDAAAKMMAGFVQQFGGDMGKALAAYNAGPGAVQKYGGIPPYAETQSYVKTILGDTAGLGAQLAQRAQEGLGAVGGAISSAVQGAQDVASHALQPVVRPANDWLDLAKAQLGKPYIWGSAGGRSIFDPSAPGFDCSGFVSYVMKQGFGVDLPAFTGTAYTATRPLGQDEQPQPGDVVFYNMGQSDPHLQHVALYIGNGQIIQAGGVRNDVNIASVNEAVGSAPEYRRPVGLPQQTMNGTAQTFVGAAAQGQSPHTMTQFIQQRVDSGQGMPSDTELGNFILSQPPEQTAASVGTPQPIQQPTSPFDVVGNLASGLGNAVSGAVSGVGNALGGLFGRGGPGGQPPQGPTETAPTATTSPFPGLPQLPTGMPPEGGGYGAGGPLLPGEAASAFAPIGQAVTGLASSPLLPTNLTNAGLQAAGQAIAPFFANPLDAAQTYTEIQRRYGGGIDPVTGRFRAPDFSNITPEDEQALANATMAVGGVATPPGESGSEALRAMTGGVSDRIPGILGGTRGVVADSPAIRQVVENAAPVSANADRFYHGTGADFPRPDAARFDPNGLFGPGYYVTSDPRVAGGVVDTAPGSTFPRTTGGYAESQMPSFYHDMREAQEDADYYRNLAAGRDPNYPNPTPEQIDKWSFSARESERRAAGLARNLPDTGPNVRAVDVPRNLNLLNVDAPAPTGLIDRVRKQVGLEGAGFDVQDHLDGLPQKPTGQDVWQAINAGGGGDRDYPNAVLQAIGYDGIRYEGGQRIPLADQAGQPIEHTAVVVFPESLDKLTNATAGTRGGLLPDLTGESAIGRIAGRAAIGGISAGAQQAQQPGATPQDIALAALQGAALGVGREALLRNLPAGARLSATLARAVEEQGGVRPPQDLSQGPTILERFGLTDRPVEGATPLSDDDLLNHYQGLEQQYEANNVQIARLADQLHEARNPGVAPIRPQWAVGLPNEAVIKIANDHGVSPYREDWWEQVGLSQGSQEVSRLLSEGGYRGVGTRRLGGSQLQNAQAELDRLRAENQAITDHLDPLTAAEPGTLYRAPAQPAELPFASPTDVVQSASREPTTPAGTPAFGPPTPVGRSEAIAATAPADLGVREGAAHVGAEAPAAAPVNGTAGGLPGQIGGFFQGTQGAMGESILRADVQRLQAQMDATRAKFPEMTDAEAAATPLGQQIESAQQQLAQRTGAAAPVSGTAGGNLPVEQIPEVQRVREAANPPPTVNSADNGIPPPPGEPPRPTSTDPGDFDANVRAAVERQAREPGSFWQVLNAYHSGNVVMGPFTLGKVAANTMFQPVWNFGTQTARDLLTLKPDRVMGRSIGAQQALVSIGSDFMDAFGQAMANRTTSSIPLVDHFLQAQHAVGGALHAGMQNVAAEAVRRMELGAAAGEQVAAQGGRGVEGLGKIADLIRDSSGLPDDAVFRAADMADRAGLRSPAGAVQQTVQNMLNQAANTPVGAVANFLLPVFRIGAQAAARGIEASPFGLIGTGIDVARAGAGFGPYAKGFSQYGQAVTPLADRLTSNIAGTALTAFLASKSLDGTITGTGPDDPKARANLEAQGWRPESVLVPGVGYVSYTRLPEQLRTPLELAGAFGDAVREHPDDPQGIAGRLAQEVGKTMAQGLPGLSTLADIGGILKGDPYAVGYLVGGSAAGYIPGSALLGNVATALDPFARKIPTTQGFGAAIGANIEQSIPGLREQLQPRVSTLGQPMPNPAAGLQGLLPVRTPGEIAPGTPGLQALRVLNANGVTLTEAPKTVTLGNGSRVDLTDDEQQQYEADRATLLDQMTSGLVNNQQFAAAPNPAKKQVLDRLIRQADAVAGRQVVGAIAQGGDFASRLQGPKRLQEPTPAIRPPLALTELNSAAAPVQAPSRAALPLTSDLATMDPLQQEQLRRQLAGTP